VAEAVEAEVRAALEAVGDMRQGDVVTAYIIVAVVENLEDGGESVVLTDSGPPGRGIPTYKARGMLEEALFALDE